MSIAAVTSVAATVAPAAVATATAKLVQLANGEYTAVSVASDPQDALKLGLIREKDGNYGAASSSSSTDSSAEKSASSVLSTLASLHLGG